MVRFFLSCKETKMKSPFLLVGVHGLVSVLAFALAVEMQRLSASSRFTARILSAESNVTDKCCSENELSE